MYRLKLFGIAFMLLLSFHTTHACSLDIDNNGQEDALTDGIILIRYQFGLRGNALIQDAMGSNAQRTEPISIELFINTIGCSRYFDVDGNDANDALTDGLITIRYLFGLTGPALTQDALASDATRVTANSINQWLTTETNIAWFGAISVSVDTGSTTGTLAWGAAALYPDENSAINRAINECVIAGGGNACSLNVTSFYDSCAAIASSNVRLEGRVDQSIANARDEALTDCNANSTTQCFLRVSFCSTQNFSGFL